MAAAAPTLPRLSLTGTGNCRFSLSAPDEHLADETPSSFHCDGEYRVVTEGNELQAGALDFNGSRLTAERNVQWINESENFSVSGGRLEYELATRTLSVSDGVRLSASGYSAESAALRFSQESGTLELSGGVRVTRASETLEALSVRISRDGSFVAESGVILNREQMELKCRRLEQREKVLAVAGDVYVRARLADSEVALTADDGAYDSASAVFHLNSVSAVFPSGDLRANEMDFNLTRKTLKARGDISGTLDGRLFSADSADIALVGPNITLSGRVRIWIPREEFHRKSR
jgi:hypothetical protein